MTDLGQVKPTFVNRLHQKANLGHTGCPTIGDMKVKAYNFLIIQAS